RSLTVVARMGSASAKATAGSVQEAQRELDVISARIAKDFADSNEGWSGRVVAAHDQLVGASRPALMMLMGAVGFLLLIVCANMANLMLARLSSRRREMAVRGALGASRWEIARPMIAESLLLSFIGGALGLIGAQVGLRVLGTMKEAQLPRMDQLQLDGGVLLFTFVISIGVALAFGLIPSLKASRQELRDVMHESSGSTGSPYARRLLSALVVVEVALALVLLVGAGLMTRSFSKLLQVSPGFDATNLVAARVLLPASKYQRGAQVGFYEAVLERVRREPGIINASAVSATPLHDVGAAGALPFNVEGQQPPPTEDPLADIRIVAPGYFETMKIKLIAGRFLDERDGDKEARTSVINETMARRYFGNESPLGRIIQNPHGKSEVVGIVGDVHNQGLDQAPKKQVYLPLRQSPTAGMALVARTERDASAFGNAIQRAIWEVDAEQPISELSTMDQVMARAVFLPRLSTTLLALFAIAALLLAALGIYGVLSYSVSQRTREIGLRMALGASGGNTVAMIVRSSLGMVAVGGAIGLIAATLLARSMAGILYGVGPFDLPAFALALLTLLIAGVVASVLPALRTTRVDPVVALRDQ
ncbi:MAG: ADOP family duplicated permease, partial [Acidobacteriota bacterium]